MRAIGLGLLVGLFVTFMAEPQLALVLGIAAAVAAYRIEELERRLARLETRWAPRSPLPAPPPTEPWVAPAATREVPTQATSAPVSPRQPPPHVSAPSPAEANRAAFELQDLERFIAGRGLAIVGGIALLLGGIFFLGLAFSRGWIGPEARVLIGLVAGIALFGMGARLLMRRQEIVAHVLVAVGLGVVSLALYAATRLYGFIEPELGVELALVAAAAAAVLAVRSGSQLIAAFGIVSVLAAPPSMGASASLVTMLFIGAALAGTTAVALMRTWRWLPPVAFLLAGPQLASYVLGSPPAAIALTAVAAFSILNILAAGGEEFRRRRDRLSESSATVLVASAAFAVWAGLEILTGGLAPLRGPFLLGVASLHLAVGSWFLVLHGERHPFGMLSAGTGIAALTLAVPIQLGAPLVPLAWAAEAVALTWIYAERRHGWSGLAAVVLAALAASHVLVIEYPFTTFADPTPAAVPFLNPDGAVLGFVLVATAVAIAILRRMPERVAVAAAAVTLIVAVAHHELTDVAHVALLVTLIVGAILVERRLLGVRLLVPMAEDDDLGHLAERTLYVAAAIAACVLGWVVLGSFLRPWDVAQGLLSSDAVPMLPFLNDTTLVAVILAGGALLVAGLAAGRLWRQGGLLVGAAVIAALIPTQLGPAWSVVAWSVLALGLHLLSRAGDEALAIGARVLAGWAVVETLTVVASPARLVVRSVFTEPAILNEGILATAALVAFFAVRALIPPRDVEARGSAIVAGAFGVWLVSIGLVDLFQGLVGGATTLAELAKQAQVGLSVLWAILGVAAFAGGLALRRAALRLSGLVLLGVVTVKVFAVDLAALDVAYRVLSFAALGILLLGAAYLYTRLQPRDTTPPVDG